MGTPADLAIVPKDPTEALIDLRVRYGRAVRLVWTLAGLTIMLTVAVLITAWYHSMAMRSIGSLSKDLERQQVIFDQQEDQRRIDRAEQRYAICQRPAEQRPAEPLCEGYETLDAAYESEGVEP